MIWTIKYSKTVLKSLKKIDKKEAVKIVDFLSYKVASLENPKSIGKGLKGGLSGIWRYRIGNYRILCEIKEKELIIIVALLGHRKNIY